MGKYYDYGIGFARLLAMISIVICHVFQALESPLCYYFNVGVQVFLFISGYLYGKKRISDYSVNTSDYSIKKGDYVYLYHTT